MLGAWNVMTKKRLMKIAVLCLAVCLCISLFACRKKDDTQPQETETTAAAEPVTYTIELVTDGAMPLENVGVYIYEDASLEELVWFAKTDAEGRMTFTDAARDTYVAVLKNIPDGYLVEESYPLTGETTQIVLTAGLKAVDDLTGVTFKLGDLMYDLTVTAADGKEYVLSELLKEKKAVVLNFWYLECQPCRKEFPYLQAAYEKYSSDIEVLALNPVNTDAEAVAAFQKEQKLTFPMAVCDPVWQEAMQLTAYPTTVVIDRYGAISLIHTGSVTEENVFESIFSYFTADDYTQGVVTDLEDILEEEQTDTTGTEDNPAELGAISSFTVQVPAGGVYYVNVYKVSKLILQINSADAYVIYNGKTYNPSGSSVSLTVTSDDVRNPVKLGIGNSSEETQTFTVRFSHPKGSLNNPYTMSLGEFDVNVASGNEQGIYYTYKCKKDGYITVQCLSATSGVPYDVVLYNLSTYAQRSMQGEGAKNADGYYQVSIKVNAGDTLQMSAGSLPDSGGNYPAVSLTLLASYDEEQPEEDVDTTITYGVTVTNEDREPVANMQVYLTVDGKEVILTTNANGVASTKLEPGTYEAMLRLVGYSAKTAKLTLTEAIPTAAVKVDVVEEERSYKDLINVGRAYYIAEGDNAEPLVADVYNYFIFMPDQTGLYQVTTDSAASEVSYWATTSYPYNASSDIENNTFTINIKRLIDDMGYVIGVKGGESCTLTVTRIGDAVLDESDADYDDSWQEGLTAPPTKTYTASVTGTMTYVDLASDATAVYSAADGRYHLNSEDGPVLYVNLGNDARYNWLYDMLGQNGDGGGAQNLCKYFYDEDNNFIRREKYTEWMLEYITYRDTVYDVYPLTDSLIYMIQNGGGYAGWWDPDSANYRFTDVDVNLETAWMFAVCYFA